MRPPQRGLTAIAKSKPHTEKRTKADSGTVHLCEFPGRAGGVPGLKLAVACRDSTAYPVREIVQPLDSLTGGASYAYYV